MVEAKTGAKKKKKKTEEEQGCGREEREGVQKKRQGRIGYRNGGRIRRLKTGEKRTEGKIKR